MSAANFDPRSVDTLRRRFRGDVITTSHPGYDDARRVWNAAVDRRPALITRCEGNDDVVRAIRFAREHDLTVAVRCGGHSVAGLSTCDGGIVIDLSPMRGIEVDPETATAHVQGGALLKDLDVQAQRYGLACPTGVVGHTGVAGLTLGGGIGRLSRAHGLTLDNLLSVELVTVDGEVVRASDGENPELFWGVRGAGANLGIVTSFEFRLQHIGEVMFAGVVVYPIERAAEIGAVFEDWAADAPRGVVGKLTFTTAPSGPPMPEHVAGRPAILVGASALGPVDAAVQALRPLRDLGPEVDLFGERPYLHLQTMNDEVMAWGRRYYWKGLFVDHLPSASWEDGASLILDAPAADAEVGTFTLGGAMGDIAEDATAFSGRSARYWQSVEIDWLDPGQDEANSAWARKSIAAYRPFAATSNYVNDLNEPGPDAVRAAYGPEKHDRLVSLKRTWDPDNVLRLNQNIRP